MLLVGHEHVMQVGDSSLTVFLIIAAAILILVALFGNTLHKAFVAGYVLLP